jgi:hypothetical protein
VFFLLVEVQKVLAGPAAVASCFEEDVLKF